MYELILNATVCIIKINIDVLFVHAYTYNVMFICFAVVVCAPAIEFVFPV